jgi:beta-mannosidase
VTDGEGPGVIDLAGQWMLRDAPGDHACPMQVPGDGISALHAVGLIPDPYFGRNEYGLRWIAERDWTITRDVTLERTAAELVLAGLDCVCTVRVNGREAIRTENAFRSYRVDLSDLAVTGRNEVSITFHAAPAEARARAEAQPFPIPYIAQNNPVPHGNMLRKPACDWGWDWNIALVPFGVTGGVRIEPKGGPRIAGILVGQEHRADGRVVVSLEIRAEAAEGAECRAALCGQEAKRRIAGGRARLQLEIADPVLWWPAGQGAQVLHDLQVTVGAARARRRIGLRRIDLVTERDAAGLSFGFRVNGRDVFARGANWIPADALAGRITREATRGLLQSAVDAHMNMIRIWGGGRYEADWFYDLCDEMGLMVWQDFMFSCNLYPSTPAFLAEVDAEVRENVARLSHHACLALWCGDNELIGALTWFPESRADRDRYLVNYDRLNRTIETALRETDPGANWWPSSPSPGVMNFRDAWHEDGSGDMHFWSVWHEGRDFDHYRDVAPRFCSEFGFQSYPSMEVIARFAGPQDRNIAAPVFESHQKNAGGNARIAETMFRYFRWPERFEDFVWLSQVQQGLAIKTAVTQWRSLKPHCMGVLYWQLNDTWPVCSWSSLDHGGGWKLLHHMARRFLAPVTVVAVPVAGGIALRAVNDGPEAAGISVTARAVTAAGAVRALGSWEVAVPADRAEPVATIAAGALAGDEMLAFAWDIVGGGGGRDIFAPRPWKAYDLVPATLSQDAREVAGGWEVRVETPALGLFVTLEADRPGRFSDNAFPLFAGEPATVTFTPDRPGPDPVFRLRELHGATMARTR